MDDKEEIRSMYKKYWEHMINKNAVGLRELMTDDYFLKHMTGVRQSREEFIKGFLAGTFNYYSAEHDAIHVSINKDTAIMIGQSKVVAAIYSGGKSCWRLQGDFTLRKENGEWKFTSSTASTY